MLASVIWNTTQGEVNHRRLSIVFKCFGAFRFHSPGECARIHLRVGRHHWQCSRSLKPCGEHCYKRMQAGHRPKDNAQPQLSERARVRRCPAHTHVRESS